MRPHPLHGPKEIGWALLHGGARPSATALILLVTLTLTFFLTRPAQADSPRRSITVDVVKKVKNAVVNIHSERTVAGTAPEELFALTPSQNRINGMGTGIIIDPRGYIVTNHHVVEDVNLIRVRLADGTTAGARVLARDPSEDLAILKIDVAQPLPIVPLGTAKDLMVGETVIAIGNAYGYDHTVTSGVVSAIKRDVTLNKDVAYRNLIQTDASINPGNSGGPLLNIYGELVGVNVAIRAGAQGIGFAIPVDTMIRVAADMLSARKRNGASHGLVVTDVVSDDANMGPGAPRRSLVVDRVDAASGLGVKRGDVITAVGDVQVSNSLDLERAFLDKPVGEAVTVSVRRNNQDETTSVALQPLDRSGLGGDLTWRKLGLKLQTASAELVSRTNQQLHGGLVVTDVRADGAASKAGIQRGDILVGLHQWEMLSGENVTFVLSHPDLATFNPLRFYIVRGGQVHRGWIQQVD